MNSNVRIQNKSRLYYLDLFKSIAILMVISLHINVWEYNFFDNGY